MERFSPESPIRRPVLSLALVATGLLLTAAAPAPAALSSEDTALVARAAAYLKGLTTDKGRFTQTDSHGAVSTGVFWLQRPGKARFEYAPPSGLVIASDGRVVSVVDRRLRTIHSYPLGLTPLSLFLARNIRLDKGVAVTAVDHRAAGFSITATDAHRRDQGRITLDFAASPLALTGWTVTDSRGRSVRVALAGFGPAPAHDRRFFQLADPNLSASPAAASAGPAG